MSICFLITTYGRKESCQRLVDALQGQGDIIVLGDKTDYTIDNCTYYNRSVHYGRWGYFKTVNELFKKRTRADYYFMLPDDFMPAPNMVERAIAIWEGIDDTQKICLNLFADRIGCTCWTGFKPIDKGSVWHSQWVDMCFMCGEYFFNMVGRMHRTYSGKSSGVGQYISSTLKNRRMNLYQVKESLVIPMEEHSNSQMHRDDNSTYRKHPKPIRKPQRKHGQSLPPGGRHSRHA